jgi:hypothetical protein
MKVQQNFYNHNPSKLSSNTKSNQKKYHSSQSNQRKSEGSSPVKNKHPGNEVPSTKKQL